MRAQISRYLCVRTAARTLVGQAVAAGGVRGRRTCSARLLSQVAFCRPAQDEGVDHVVHLGETDISHLPKRGWNTLEPSENVGGDIRAVWGLRGAPETPPNATFLATFSLHSPVISGVSLAAAPTAATDEGGPGGGDGKAAEEAAMQDLAGGGVRGGVFGGGGSAPPGSA